MTLWVPLGAALLFTYAVVAYLGWWRPVLRDDRPGQHPVRSAGDVLWRHFRPTLECPVFMDGSRSRLRLTVSVRTRCPTARSPSMILAW